MTARVSLTIVNQRGLHARAAAKFVRVSEQFSDTQIMVLKDDMQVVGTSIMGLLMLGACKGSTVAVEAEGVQATAALQAIAELVENRFGEDE
jgi:phosphocarrier protein